MKEDIEDIIPEPIIDQEDESHHTLKKLRDSLQNPEFLAYLDNLERDAEQEGIKVAAVDPAELDEEEGNLEKERILGITSLAKAHHTHQLQLLSKEQKARKKLQKQFSKQQKSYLRLKEDSAHTHQLQQVEVSKIFRQKELDIKTAMKKKNADLEVKLQQSSEDQLLLGGITRVYKLSWRGRPQVVEIRVDECRDVKDKLERGEYWIRITTKDKIGGKILEYEKLTDDWRNISDAYFHEGKASSRVMKFRTTLKILVPSKMQISPSMVYCMQILDLNMVIVGETYFPIVNNLFEVNEGKFKAPILRSSLKTNVDKFQGIEELYRKNIDEWLCNLYFQVSMLPQVIEGENDYSVELHGSKVLQEEAPTEAEPKNYEELFSPDQYSEYKHSVARSGILITPKNKLNYIISELVLEFGFHFYKHSEVYISFIILILAIWAGRYFHFAGQWLYLKAEQVSITEFEAQLFTLKIRYNDQINLRQEALIVIIGTLFQAVWFGFCCLWAALSLFLIGRLPQTLYRIFVSWGLVMIFDPIITVVEAIIWGFAYDYWKIDPFRLYNYFSSAEGNGVVGILLTFFLYSALTGFCCFIFYNYFLYLHMNGRLLDIYMRLNGQENRFFIPHDGEVSKRYLEWVCYKAKNYRSINGDSRKISVMNYDLFEGFSEAVSKTATHVVVYTVGNDRSRALYRQFVRLPEGAIVELALTEHSHRSTFSRKYSGSMSPLRP